MAEEIEMNTFSLEDKCTHKLWKIRMNGYEECIIFFGTTPENQSSDFSKFENLLKTFCSDPNAISLDKALETVLAFIKNCHVSSRTVVEIAEVIISKSLAAPKKGTKEKAASILLKCCQVGHTEPVQQEILKGFSHKNPKVVIGCLQVLTSIIKEFGKKDLDFVDIITNCGSTLFEHRDKLVRLEAKNMTIEIYRSVGDSLLPKLASLKAVVLQDLKLEFNKLTIEKESSTPLAIHEQPCEDLKPNEKKMAEVDVIKTHANEPEVLNEPEIVNILKKLPSDFYEKIEAKKWQDRRELLELLLPLSKHPKLAPGDYYDLVMSLTQVIGKDTNVLLVTLAGNCLTGIAKGLHKKFASYATACLKIVLGKFKEKKQSVLVSLRETAEAIFRSTNVDAIRETVVPFLSDKNPSVKQETASFIARCFCYCTPKMLGRKVLKFYSCPLLKMLKEPDPNVRDSAAEALGAALKVVGDTAMGPLLDGVEPPKLVKIKEYSEKTQIKVKLVSVKSKSTKEHPTGTCLSQIGVEKTEKNCDTNNTINDLVQHKEKQVTSIAINKKPVAIGKQTASGPLLSTNATKALRIQDEQRLRTYRWEFTVIRKEIVAQLKKQMETADVNENLITNMFHSESKFHLKCIDQLKKDLSKNLEGCIANLDLILRWLTIRLSDVNCAVILKATSYLTEVITRLSHRGYQLLDFEAQSFLPFLILKLGDPNELVRESTMKTLSLVCNIYASSKISPYILKGMQSDNPLQRAGCIEFFGTLFERIGILVCQPTPSSALTQVATLIGDSDNDVRIAAIDVLAKVFVKEKDLFNKYIGKLPDEHMSLLEGRINCVEGTKAKAVHSPCPRMGEFSQPVNNEIKIESEVISMLTKSPIRPNIISPLEDTETFKSKFKSDYAYIEKLLGDDRSEQNPIGRVITNENVEPNLTIIGDTVHEILPVIHNSETSRIRDTTPPKVKAKETSKEHIDDIISQILHPHYKNVTDAVALLNEMISMKNFEPLLPCVDLLLTTIAQRYETSLDSDETDDCMEIFRCLNSILLQILQEKDLATVASRRSLYAIGHSILTIIVYSRLCQVEGGVEVIRELNTSVIMMIQNADFTQIFSALLQLLHSAVATDLNSQFTVVAMKCTWKAIRALPARRAELNISPILGDLNEFMIAFPPHTWCDKSSNKPLKTIKTVLHCLVETYGSEALVHLHALPNYTESELEKYIVKSINMQKSAEETTVVRIPSLAQDSDLNKPLQAIQSCERNRVQRSDCK